MRYGVSEAKVAWRVIDGEGVLLHAETSAYFGLNRTGTMLWERLVAGAMSAEELTDWMAGQVSHGGSSMRNEIPAFLEQLKSQDLLEDVSVAPGGNGHSPQVAADRLAGVVYEAPLLTPFGELEKLILSGE